MPAYPQQLPYFRDYGQRVSQKYVEAARREEHLTLQQARQLVWQEIEESLHRVFLQTETGKTH
jgi:hypothetical protein